jgi:hypothetical protein
VLNLSDNYREDQQSDHIQGACLFACRPAENITISWRTRARTSVVLAIAPDTTLKLFCDHIQHTPINIMMKQPFRQFLLREHTKFFNLLNYLSYIYFKTVALTWWLRNFLKIILTLVTVFFV